MTQPLEQFVNDLLAAWNSHDIDRAAKFYAAGYIGDDVGQAMPHRGPAGIREFLARYLSAFPDFHFALDELVVDGNRVALVWTANGTHQGTLMNIPPTGRRISIRGVSLLTVQDNQVQQASYIWDVAGLLRNIGLLPEL